MALALINVNQSIIQKIDKTLECNSTLNLIIDKLINSTFKGGVTAFVKVGNEKVSLSKSGNDIIKNHW